MHAHARRAAGKRAARKAPVVAVNNEDKALRVLIVVAPQGADLVLATHIPNSEADVLVPDRETSNKKTNLELAAPQPRIPQRAHSLHGLNVEADGGNSGDLQRGAGRVSSAGASGQHSDVQFHRA